MSYKEVWIDRDGSRIYARDYPGQEPAIVLMHGLPDNRHLYDRLLPYLNPPRRVITFDFLGWGDSDRPTQHAYTATNQIADVDAVISQLGLDEATVVVHDASGPPGIDWALDHPDRVSALILLNTYYCLMPTLLPPEAIFLYSTPLLRNLGRTVARAAGFLDRKLYIWQVGRFIADASARRELVPRLYEDFKTARPAFWALNNDLLGTVISRTRRIPEMRRFTRPVRIIFGERDPYLNKGVARRFHKLFPGSDLFLVSGARHYVQVDKPQQVAKLILDLEGT